MKKTLQLLLLSLFLLMASFSPSHIRAEDPAPGIWSDQGTADSYEAAASGDVNATAHVANVNTNNYADLIRRTVGPVEGVTVTGMNSPLAKQMLAQSAIYNISSYIYAMYTTPVANTYAFVQDVGVSLGFIPKPVYAQGVGFSGLSALLPIWKLFRNMAYFLLAIMMIAIGFMVMFRKKIDPKTVVTIQNALPNIILALLLITFSYAIVGLCIDLMYLLIAIIGSIFKSSQILTTLQTKNYLNGELWGSVFDTVPESELLPRILFGTSNSGAIQATMWGLSIGGAITMILTAFTPLGIGAFLVASSPLFIGAIISLGLFGLVIRLFFFFISAYIKIIIALVFAPFQLLTVAIPGSKGFDSWFRNLIGNVLIFPVSTVMFLLASVFMNIASTPNSLLWSPPFARLIVNNATSVGTIVALGILFAIPTVGKQITDMLKAKPMINADAGSLISPMMAPVKTVMGSLQMFYYGKELLGGFFKKGGKKDDHSAA